MAGAIFGGLAVALGAFGAHGLESVTTDEKIHHSFQTAVLYQFFHALALLAIGIIAGSYAGKWISRAATMMIIGVILFSGSLYLISILKIQGYAGIKFIGPLTPLGGIFLILGWLFFLLAVSKTYLPQKGEEAK
jgi:uncharacterized membrane protein YgdD (TMEM256/DUF423 family)